MIYRIADLDVKINNRFPFTDKFCKDYLVVDGERFDLEVSVSDEDLATEKKQSPDFSDGYIETSAYIAIYAIVCPRSIAFLCTARLSSTTVNVTLF